MTTRDPSKTLATLYPEDPAKPTLRFTLHANEKERLAQLQSLVGGYIEYVVVRTDGGADADAVINEEGKLCGLAVNTRASRLYWNKYPQTAPSGMPNDNPDTDYLCGPVVVLDPRTR